MAKATREEVEGYENETSRDGLRNNNFILINFMIQVLYLKTRRNLTTLQPSSIRKHDKNLLYPDCQN